MFWRITFSSIAILLFGGLVYLSLDQYRRESQISVVLLTVESLRADLVGKDTTPMLLQTATKAYRSQNHRAISGWTGTNIISLLSGLSPFQAGVHTRGQSVDGEDKQLLERLADKGYRVAGLQGFMTMDLYRNLGLDIGDVGSDPIFWLTERGRDRQPFFLWEHYVHTHLPYKPGSGYELDVENMVTDSESFARVKRVMRETNIAAGSTLFQPEDVGVIRALHEANVREFDDWFAAFWEFFTQSGLSSRTILIVTADHGDEHGERGSVGHASTTGGGHLHEEIVRVPLFIWLPERLQQDSFPLEFSTSNHLDVMVTLAQLLGLSVEEELEGLDLFTGQHRKQHFAMTSGGGFSEKDPHNIQYYEYSLTEGEWKLLWRIYGAGKERVQLYNLKKDPGEERDVKEHNPEIYSKLQNNLRKKIEIAEHRPVHLLENGTEFAGNLGPEWIFPVKSGSYKYEDLDGKFLLSWKGEESADFILQYKAGHGDTALEGQLEVQGTVKDFGTMSKRYWTTWIVPASPIKVRVRQSDRGGWSKWLILEAQP